MFLKLPNVWPRLKTTTFYVAIFKNWNIGTFVVVMQMFDPTQNFSNLVGHFYLSLIASSSTSCATPFPDILTISHSYYSSSLTSCHICYPSPNPPAIPHKKPGMHRARRAYFTGRCLSGNKEETRDMTTSLKMASKEIKTAETRPSGQSRQDTQRQQWW